jgi:hypothetical protein
MRSANLVYRALLAAGLFAFLPVLRIYAADSGLISKPSDHSVQETACEKRANSAPDKLYCLAGITHSKSGSTGSAAPIARIGL